MTISIQHRVHSCLYCTEASDYPKLLCNMIVMTTLSFLQQTSHPRDLCFCSSCILGWEGGGGGGREREGEIKFVFVLWIYIYSCIFSFFRLVLSLNFFTLFATPRNKGRLPNDPLRLVFQHESLSSIWTRTTFIL